MTEPKQPKPVDEIIEEVRKDKEREKQEITLFNNQQVDEKIRNALLVEDEKGTLRSIGQIIGRTEPEMRAMANGARELTDYDRIVLMDQLHLEMKPTGK